MVYKYNPKLNEIIKVLEFLKFKNLKNYSKSVISMYLIQESSEIQCAFGDNNTG
jgi:hypothetical protein